jgi:hypothetical protein
MKEILERYKTMAYHAEVNALSNIIRYYNDNYLPELRENSGYTQFELIERYKRELESVSSDYRLGVYEPKIETVANVIRNEAQRCFDMTNACYYGTNSIYWLRETIKHLQELKKLIPELKIYSNRWLALRYRITILAPKIN